MADFRGLKGFALARESAFFKLEQEADIQKHRSRLVTQGRIEDIAGGYLMPRRQQTLSESVKSFEVLAEVLQQQARVDDPMAAHRRKFLRRVKVSLPEISEAERRMYRSALYGIAGIGQIPKVNLGRNKFVNHGGPNIPDRHIPTSPKIKEASRRAFATGVRSLAYGTVLGGITSVLVVGGLASWYRNSSPDLDSFREGLQERGQVAGDFLQSRLPEKSSFVVVSSTNLSKVYTRINTQD